MGKMHTMRVNLQAGHNLKKKVR